MTKKSTKEQEDVTRTPQFDPTVPRVAAQIGDEVFELSFDFRALATAKSKLRALETPVEVNILHALDFRSIDVDTLPAMFYAAAQRYQPELTYERACELVTIRNAMGIYAALGEAYVQAIGKGDAENPPKADAAALS